MVKVTSPNSENKITVRDMSGNITVTTTGNLAEQYARTSQAWATSEGIVAGQDYSSKHYANVSKEYAEIAKGHKDETINIVSGFQDIVDNSKEEIEVVAQNNISNLRASAETTMSEIQETIDSSLETINTAVSENISTIESKANEEIENLNKEIEQGKDEIKDTIDGVKVLTTLKIGQIGIAPLGIDETLNMERYLNGQIIIQDQFKGFTKFLKRRIELYPSLACTEDEWQTTVTMSAFSQCGKFVIDDNAGTIRLPKVVNIQGLTDLSKLGEIVEAGLPNITGTFGRYLTSGKGLKGTGTGAFVATTISGYGAHSYNDARYGVDVSLNASRSSSIYGNSNTVQQEQIQYPYFIQVATGAEVEDNIINEIELNNPYSFGDSKYSPKPLNNLSWLKSEGQWNSKAVYPSYYDWALINANNGVECFVTTNMYYFKCTTEDLVYCLTTATAKIGQAIYGLNTGFKGYVEEVTSNGFKFTDKEKGFIEFITDTNSYTHNPTDYEFVINPADETFRLPLLDGSEVLPSDKYDDLTLNASGSTYTAPTNGWFSIRKISGATDKYLRISNRSKLFDDGVANSDVADEWLFGKVLVEKGDIVEVAYSATGKTSYFRFIYAQGNGSLYFYVGETVQNANLINAGRIEEKLADCITRNDCKAYIVETYQNGTSWYRVWSDNWCEQGGYTKAGTTINLLKPYANNTYSVSIGVCSSGADTQPTEPKISIKSTTQFKFNQAYNGSNTYNAASYEWRLAGFIA